MKYNRYLHGREKGRDTIPGIRTTIGRGGGCERRKNTMEPLFSNNTMCVYLLAAQHRSVGTGSHRIARDYGQTNNI